MIDKTVHKDAATFVVPHPHNLFLLLMHLENKNSWPSHTMKAKTLLGTTLGQNRCLIWLYLGICQVDPLEDLRNVAQIEQIVALLWSWQKTFERGHKQCQSSRYFGLKLRSSKAGVLGPGIQVNLNSYSSSSDGKKTPGAWLQPKTCSVFRGHVCSRNSSGPANPNRIATMLEDSARRYCLESCWWIYIALVGGATDLLLQIYWTCAKQPSITCV